MVLKKSIFLLNIVYWIILHNFKKKGNQLKVAANYALKTSLVIIHFSSDPIPELICDSWSGGFMGNYIRND